MSDAQLEVFNAGKRTWRTVNEAGTQLRYEGRDPEEIEEGSFVLINGDNTKALQAVKATSKNILFHQITWMSSLKD